MLENRSTLVNAPSPSREQGASLPSRQRARRTNDPLAAGLDMNTARGRRVADLMRAYLKALGNPADIERQAAVIQAAELTVLAEEARAAALRSGTADLDQVVRVQGAADRAVRRLGLRSGAAPKGPSLAEHLARLTLKAEANDASADMPADNEAEAAA